MMFLWRFYRKKIKARLTPCPTCSDTGAHDIHLREEFNQYTKRSTLHVTLRLCPQCYRGKQKTHRLKRDGSAWMKSHLLAMVDKL